MSTTRETLAALAGRPVTERLEFLEEQVIRLTKAIAAFTGAFQTGIDAADGAITGDLYGDEVRGD